MTKITINMVSSADKVKGQGVGSAYLEQVSLVKNISEFEVKINSKRDADIIHHHTLDPFNYFMLKTCKGIHVTYVHFLPSTLEGSITLPKGTFKTFKKYVVNFYKKSDYLVVVNPIFIEELVKLGIDRERVTYIPNYVSKENFYELERDKINAIKDDLDIKNDSFVVIGVGQVQSRKGVMDFVEVAKKLPTMTFIWCGGFSFGAITDGYNELKKVVENPPENVKFLGIIDRDKMNDMYNISDALFMPSYNELFPMSILEAVNTKIPLVLRDLDLYEDILFKKYLCGKNNNEFIKLLLDLKNNKEIYSKYSNYSKEISNYYSKENVMNLWKEYYLKIYNIRLVNKKQKI